MTKQEKLLSESEVMEILGVSQSTLRRLRERKEINFYKIGKSVRYKFSEIIRFIDERKVQKQA